MRLSQLQYLVTLHRCGTFSKAAEALYVSQPAISVAIRELEEELGFPLLIRGRKGLEFTLEGLQVLERARLVLREVANIRAVRPSQDTVRGTCVIGATPHFCTSILMELRLRMQRDNPELHVIFREYDSCRVMDELEQGSLDMGIVQLCDMEEGGFWHRVEDLGLRHTELFSEEMCAAVGEHHPLAGCKRVPFRELAAFPYGTYRGAMNQQIRRLLREVPDPLIFSVDDIGPLREMIFRQNAYTVIPVRAVQRGNSLYHTPFVPLEIEDMPLFSRIVLLRGQSGLTPAGDVLVKELIPIIQHYLESR